MFASNPHDIKALQLNSREKEHNSREIIGFHVYLSRYFFDFNKLDLPQQHNISFVNNSVQLGERRLDRDEDRNDPINSTDALWNEKVPRECIHRMTCFG